MRGDISKKTPPPGKLSGKKTAVSASIVRESSKKRPRIAAGENRSDNSCQGQARGEGTIR